MNKKENMKSEMNRTDQKDTQKNKYQKKYWVNETNGWHHKKRCVSVYDERWTMMMKQKPRNERTETDTKNESEMKHKSPNSNRRTMYICCVSTIFQMKKKRMKFIIYSDLIGGKMEILC